MRLNYKFSNLCGVVYRGGSIVYSPDGTGMYASVGKRVSYFDLVRSESFTFATPLPHSVQHLALSPNGSLLVAIDQKGQLVLFSTSHRVALHWFKLEDRVSAMTFSSDGTLLALSFGSRIKVYRVPDGSEDRQFAPFRLIYTMAGHTDDIVTLEFSPCGKYLLSAATDMTARLYNLKSGKKSDVKGVSSCIASRELRGHRHPLVAAYFSKSLVGGEVDRIVTVGRDGNVWLWNWKGFSVEGPISRGHLLKEAEEDDKAEDKLGEEKEVKNLAIKEWHFKINAISFNSTLNMLVCYFTNGLLTIHSILPTISNNFSSSLECLYRLTVTGNSNNENNQNAVPQHDALNSSSRVSDIAINSTGEWIALGMGKRGQVLVWEWRSESYVLKQQGHATPASCLAYSPDGQTLVTGGPDGVVKVWLISSGVSIVSFTDHSAPVSAVCFGGSGRSGKVILSASTDGTIRAYDLLRYRNFRILTTPTEKAVQFSSLAVDPSGEVVAAGTMDTFEIYLWSLQTGQVLEILTGHTGPVNSLSFDSTGQRLASGSWDNTVRLWEVFSRDHNVQELTHSSSVLSLSFRPDGQQLAVATMKGEIAFWDVDLAQQTGLIECRRDIASSGPLSTATLKDISYSPDGQLLVVGGSFDWVGIYAVESRILVKKFPLTRKRYGKEKDRMAQTEGLEEEEKVGSLAVRMSPTNRTFCALTREGILIYSRNEQIIFDPYSLDSDLTPEKVSSSLQQDEYLKALVQALRLNIPSLSEKVIYSIPIASLPLIASSLPTPHLGPLLSTLATLLSAPTTTQLPRLVRWCAAILQSQAMVIRGDRVKYGAAVRLLIRSMRDWYNRMSPIVRESIYTIPELLTEEVL